MSNSLSIAEVIGGAVVTISADLSGLRAGYAESKKIVADIGQQTAIVRAQVVVDRSEVTRLTTSIGTLTIPIRLDIGPAMAQMQQLRAGGSTPEITGRSRLALTGPSARAGGVADEIIDAEWTPVKPRLALPSPGNSRAGAYNGMGYDFGNIEKSTGKLAFASEKAAKDCQRAGGEIDKAAGSLAVFGKILAVAEGIRGTSTAIGAAFRAITASDPDKAGQAVQQGQDAIESLPFGIGKIASTAGQNHYSLFSSIGNFVSGNGLEDDQQAAARIREEAAKLDMKSDRFARIGAGQDEQKILARNTSRIVGRQNRDALGAPEWAIYNAAQDELDDYNRKADEIRKAAGLRQDSGEAIVAREALQQKVAIARRQADAQRIGEVTASDITLAQTQRAGDVAMLRATGQGRAADTAGIIGQRDDQAFAIVGEMGQMDAIGSKDTDKRIRLAAQLNAVFDSANKQLQAYDEALKREEQEIVAGAAAGTEIVKLRSEGRIGEANEAAIRESYRDPLRMAGEKFGDGSDAVKSLEARRDAEIQADKEQRAKGATQRIASLEAEATASQLRIRGEFHAAEKTLFEANAKARIEQLKRESATQQEIDAASKVIAGQRAEMNAADKRAERRFADQMAGRQYIAGIDPQMQMLAGVAGRLLGMDAELKAANDPESKLTAGQRQQLVQTQQAELLNLQQSILAPNRYATEGDRNREARGNMSGDEQQKALDLIASHLRDILDKMGTGTLGS